jgi:hypothetical protein
MPAMAFSSGRHRMSPMGSMQDGHTRWVRAQQASHAACPFLHWRVSTRNKQIPHCCRASARN